MDAGNRVPFPTRAAGVLTVELSHQLTNRNFIGTAITENHCVQVSDTATFQVIRFIELKQIQRNLQYGHLKEK